MQYSQHLLNTYIMISPQFSYIYHVYSVIWSQIPPQFRSQVFRWIDYILIEKWPFLVSKFLDPVMTLWLDLFPLARLISRTGMMAIPYGPQILLPFWPEKVRCRRPLHLLQSIHFNDLSFNTNLKWFLVIRHPIKNPKTPLKWCMRALKMRTRSNIRRCHISFWRCFSGNPLTIILDGSMELTARHLFSSYSWLWPWALKTGCF